MRVPFVQGKRRKWNQTVTVILETGEVVRNANRCYKTIGYQYSIAYEDELYYYIQAIRLVKRPEAFQQALFN